MTIESYLNKRLQAGTVPHAILFAGSPQSTKETAALQFARKLISCDEPVPHPDLYILTPEGKLGLHTMDTLKNLREGAYLPPFSAKRKCFVIFEAERMALTSANALLKTLEEPLPTSYILLISSFSERLLPTIRSRCQALFFPEDSSLQPAPIPKLMDILRSFSHLTYPALFEHIHALAEEMESKAHIEPEKPAMEATAYQKQNMEKQREGKVALQLSRLAEACFSHILGWFRDLHLLHLRGNPAHLFHPNETPITQQWVERGIIPPLHPIEQAIKQAEKSLERSSPLQNVLESLFIDLRRISFS
jgi:DNA polymerase-3 subunit delta'